MIRAFVDIRHLVIPLLSSRFQQNSHTLVSSNHQFRDMCQTGNAFQINIRPFSLDYAFTSKLALTFAATSGKFWDRQAKKICPSRLANIIASSDANNLGSEAVVIN